MQEGFSQARTGREPVNHLANYSWSGKQTNIDVSHPFDGTHIHHQMIKVRQKDVALLSRKVRKGLKGSA